DRQLAIVVGIGFLELLVADAYEFAQRDAAVAVVIGVLEGARERQPLILVDAEKPVLVGIGVVEDLDEANVQFLDIDLAVLVRVGLGEDRARIDGLCLVSSPRATAQERETRQ